MLFGVSAPFTFTPYIIVIMPPIPVAFPENILRLISSVERRRTDLDEFQIPRLRSCNGPLSLQQNLAAEVKEDIESLSQQVEVNPHSLECNTLAEILTRL